MPFEKRKVPVNQKETTKLLHNITQIMNHLSVQSRFFILGEKKLQMENAFTKLNFVLNIYMYVIKHRSLLLGRTFVFHWKWMVSKLWFSNDKRHNHICKPLLAYNQTCKHLIKLCLHKKVLNIDVVCGKFKYVMRFGTICTICSF